MPPHRRPSARCYLARPRPPRRSARLAYLNWTCCRPRATWQTYAIQLSEEWGREQRLRTAIKTVEDTYDVCIVDSPPTLSLISVNIFRAVTEVLVPVDSGIYSVAGSAVLNETIEPGPSKNMEP